MSLTLDGTSGITSSGGTNVLQADAVITANLQNGAVTTAKIADLGVTEGKLANSAVATAKIADNAVTIAKLSATGTASSSTFLRGDGSWQSPAGGVTSLNGETGAITNTGVSSIGNTVSGVISGYNNAGSGFTLGSTYTGVQAYTVTANANGTNFTSQAGTWRCVGGTGGAYVQNGPQANMVQALFVRIS